MSRDPVYEENDKLHAENAKLRADLAEARNALLREGMERDKLRAEVAELRKQASPVAAAPSDAPDGYAYRYATPMGGTVLRFNNGEEVNGCKPTESVPYWLSAHRPAPPASDHADRLEEALADAVGWLEACVAPPREKDYAQAVIGEIRSRIAKWRKLIGDDEDEVAILPELVDYGKSIGAICKKCGYGVKLCKCEQPAPAASSALREAAQNALGLLETATRWNARLVGYEADIERLRAALAAEPEVQPERTRVVRNAEGGEDIYVFSAQSNQRFLMCQEEDGQFTVLFSDREIGLSHVVELPPSDAALKQQPVAVVVPEDVLLYAKEWNLPLDARSDNCASTMTVALWILSLAASGAAPQAAAQGDEELQRLLAEFREYTDGSATPTTRLIEAVVRRVMC